MRADRGWYEKKVWCDTTRDRFHVAKLQLQASLYTPWCKKQRSGAQSEDLGNRENAPNGKVCHATSPTTAWPVQQKSSSLIDEDNKAHSLHKYIFAVGLHASSSNLQIAANVFSSTALRHLLTTIGMDKQYLHTGPFTFVAK